jgi:hypothetical protein
MVTDLNNLFTHTWYATMTVDIEVTNACMYKLNESVNVLNKNINCAIGQV